VQRKSAGADDAARGIAARPRPAALQRDHDATWQSGGRVDTFGVVTQPRLVFEEVDRNLIGPYVALSRTQFADEFPSDPDHTIWKHLANPQGTSVAHDLYDGTTLIGRIVYQIREFTLDGRKLRAGYLTDLLIHPAHRGMGNFLRLMKQVRSVPGVDFIYVTPNATSGPLFRSALRFARNYPLSVMACPLRTGTILAQVFGWRSAVLAAALDGLLGFCLAVGRLLLGSRPRRVQVSEQRASDAEIDALDRVYADRHELAGTRGASFHRWRFHDGPIFRTRVLYCRREGELVGYVALREQDYLGYRTAFVIDACFAPGVSAATIRHVRFAALALARREGCDLVLGIFMRENPALARFCAFPLMPVPERYLPQAVDMRVEPITPGTTLPDDPARYHITLADLDVF
jgi:GNAT superfamily N-acetyltransferase